MPTREEIDAHLADVLSRHPSVPQAVARRLLNVESGGNQSAVSPKGALGLMQLMPATAREMGVDSTDWKQNIEGGIGYLDKNIRRFGSVPLGVAAYHAGPGAVERAGGIPNTNDGIMATGDYVNAIAAGGARRLSSPGGDENDTDELPGLPGWKPTHGGLYGIGDERPSRQLPKKAGWWDNASGALKLGMAGAGKAVREGVRQVFGDGVVKSIEDLGETMGMANLDDQKKRAWEGLSPEWQDALHKDWVSDKEGEFFGPAFTDWRSYAGGLLQSLPEEALTMFPAFRLAKTAQIMARGSVLRAAGEHGLARQAAGKAGMSRAAAESAAAKFGDQAMVRTATIAGGLLEGLDQAGHSAIEVRDEIMKLPESTLEQSDAYLALAEKHGRGEARRILANDKATQAYITAGAITSLFGGQGDRVLAKLVTGRIEGTILRRAGAGVVAEGLLEEFPQSFGSQIAQNLAIPGKAPLDDALNRGVGGAVLGGIQGGAIGALAGRRRLSPAVQPDTVRELPPDSSRTLPGAPTITDDQISRLHEQGNAEATPQREWTGADRPPRSEADVAQPGLQRQDDAALPEEPSEAEVAQRMAQTAQMEEGDVGRPKDGAPFKHRIAAHGVSAKQGLKDTHEVVQLGPDAFVLRKKNVDEQPAALVAESQVPAPEAGDGGVAPTPEPQVATPVQPTVPHETTQTPTQAEAQTPTQAEGAPTTKAAGDYYASTQVALPKGLAADVKKAAKALIKPADVHTENGLEQRPHVTVRYGLHDNAPEAVRKLLADEPPVRAKITNLEVFIPEGKDYDVLVARVDSPDLHRLNAKIAALPHTDTFPEYKPHITLGYVKRGAGKQYESAKSALVGRAFTVSDLEFSDQDENITSIPLTGKAATAPTAKPETAKPETAKPETAKPETAKPETAKQKAAREKVEAEAREKARSDSRYAERVNEALKEWKVGDWTHPSGAIATDVVTPGVPSVYHSGTSGTIVGIDAEKKTADVEFKSLYIRKGEPTVIRVPVTDLNFDYANPAGRASKVPPADPLAEQRKREEEGDQRVAQLNAESAAKKKGSKEAAIRAKQAERTAQADAFNAMVGLDALAAKAKSPAPEFEAAVIEQMGTWLAEQRKTADHDRAAALTALRKAPDGFFASLQKALVKKINLAERAAAKAKREAAASEKKGPLAKKLENTGADLRRHWELVKAQLKAKNDAEGVTGMNKIFTSTTRADLFADLAGKDATPGTLRYIEKLRDQVHTFKEWVTSRHGPLYDLFGKVIPRLGAKTIEDFIRGESWVMSRRAKDAYRGIIDDEILDGPNFSSQDTPTIQDRLTLLANAADTYLSNIRPIADLLRGATTLEGAAKAVTEKVWTQHDPQKMSRWTGFSQDNVTPFGKLLAESGVLGTTSFTEYVHSGSHFVIREKEMEGREGTARKERLTPPRLERHERKGLTDVRKGNVTPAQFKETFGFADVGFGTWVMAKEDQGHLNAAYDSFMDLANHLGIDPTLIGMKGKLHFTLGALGHGSKAAATFHPSHPGPNGPVRVINLTKTKGDGTIAHEWFHALDYFLSMTVEGEVTMRELLDALSKKHSIDDIRIEVMRALDGRVYMQGHKRDGPVKTAEAIARHYHSRGGRSTDYKRAADAMDQKYWGNPQEMRARAWEAWVSDTLGSGEGVNNYLVNPEWVGEGKLTKPRYKGTPYPLGEERKAFKEWFTALARSLTVKDGVVAIDRVAWMANKPFKKAEFDQQVNELIAEIPLIDAQREREKKEVANAKAAEVGLVYKAQQDAARAAAEAQAREDATKPSEPPPAQPNATLDASDLDRLFDEAAESVKAETNENPLAPEPGEPALRDDPSIAPGKFDGEPTPKAVTKPDKAATLVAEAAKLGVTGIDEAMKGLTALFGGGKIQSFPGGFDEDSYQKALPHFRASLKAFQAAGKSLKDLFKLLVQQFGEGIKPYAIRFAQDEKLTATLGENPSASMRVARAVRSKLEAGTPFDWKTLFAWADEDFGGTQAEGKYTPKDAYDALEAGMNRHILSKDDYDPTRPSVEGAKKVLNLLGIQTKLLPTQTKRTQEQDEFQQFSTVPALAYVANWVANIHPGETMLEPSAGIGGLAVFAKLAGANVIVNELSSRRAAVLREVLPDARVFTENAEHINNLLPEDVRPTVIVMNPPFSATAGRIEGQRDTMNGAKHIESALKILAPGGRLVAIVGNGMDESKPAFKDWWKKIKAEYAVRANVNINGDEYAKYGTTFDTNLLVIDNTGPTTGGVVTGRAEAYAELPDLLKGVRNDRTQPRASDFEPQQAADQPGSGETAAGGLAGPVQPAHPDVGDVGDRGRGAVTGPRGPSAPPVGNGPQQGNGVRDGNGRRGQSVSGSDGRPSNRGVDDSGSDRVTPASDVELDVVGAQKRATELTDNIFEPYEPRKAKLRGSQPHPGRLVESAAMAAVEPVDVTYTPNLPKHVIEKGLLSSAQIEAVIYAGQAHQQDLPDGTRRGFFIGDGTGVGKGREISGIILDNQRQGRKKHLWISAKSDLFDDAKRDFSGVDGDPASLFPLSKFKPKDLVDNKAGVMFLSYDLLKDGERKSATEKDKKVRSRLDQIVDWLGSDFDGVIAFDEAHNMGNLGGQKGKRGDKKPSQKAIAGFELQKLLPRARVVYVSATGATEVANLMYATRLGLWGAETAFSDANAFASQISAAGLATMELVARDMKAQGSYIARALDYHGVEQDKLPAPLTELQTEIYDELAKAWQIVLQNVNAALETTNAAKNSRAKSNALSAFWGTQQRFFNQVITAMQTPTIIERARAELAAGNSVVFQLVNTNEAGQERVVEKAEAEGTELEELDFTPRQTLIGYIEKSFPVALYQNVRKPDSGKISSVAVLDANGQPVLDREAVKKRDALIETLKEIRVPDNPIDLIMEGIGHKNVAEITGRSRRFVKEVDKEGNYKLIEQKRGKAHNKADSKAFMAGQKRALIFSDAGGTGFSFHSDLGVKNQQRRVHFLVQAGWRADNAMQGLGRTHRSNEANQPLYLLPHTNLKAQKRFISSIARRLDQLGALTKGQRNTSSQGLFNNRDNLESKYANAALRALLEDWSPGRRRVQASEETIDSTSIIKAMGLEGIYDDNGSLIEKKMPEVTQFLNRLLSLTLAQQDITFGEFEQRMDAAIDAAIAKGTFDDGMQTLKALKVEKIRDEPIFIDKRTGATTRYLELKLTSSTTLNEWQTVQDLADQYTANGKPVTYYRDNQTHQPFALFNLGTATDVHGRTLLRGYRLNVKAPSLAQRGVYITNRGEIEGGGQARRITRDDKTEKLGPRYEKIGASEAAYLWGESYDEAPKTQTETMHMLSGILLPVWDRIKGHGEEGHAAAVVRTQTDDGERLIGRVLPEAQRNGILKNFGIGAVDANASARSLLDRIMAGETAQLANGWLLKKVRVAHDNRIELKAGYLGRSEQQLLKDKGAFIERIGYQERVFLPTGENQEAVFEAITRSANRPVVDFLSKSTDGDEEAKFSRADTQENDERSLLVRLYRAIAGHSGPAEAFQLGTSKAKDLAEIGKDMIPGGLQVYESPAAAKDPSGLKVFRIRIPGKSEEAVVRRYANGKVDLNVDAFKETGDGIRLYQVVATYAHNNGLTFVGDKDGISLSAMYRRTENLISAALRAGTTKHLEPHPHQIDEELSGSLGLRPIDWKPGQHDHNLSELLLTSHQNVSSRLRVLDNWEYDFTRGEFIDRRTGQPVSSDDFDARAEGEGARAVHAGRATLARTVLTASLLRRVRSEGRAGLLGVIDSLQRGPLPFDLEKRLYSRADEAPERGLSVGTVERQIAEIMKGWKNKPEIRVVATNDGLPFTAPRDVYGAWSRGKVWVVAGNLDSALKVERLLAHEVFHRGVEQIPGYPSAMRRLWARNANLRSEASKWKHNNEKPANTTAGAYEIRAMEEGLARMAEDGRPVTGLTEFASWLAGALRKLGLTKMADWLEKATDADVLKFIAEAHAFSKGDPVRDEGARTAPAFSEPAPIWRSALTEAVAARGPFAKDGSIAADQLVRWLDARGKDGTVKPDEIEWSGVKDWLGTQKKVTREQVDAFLQENGVKVEETMLGEEGESSRAGMHQRIAGMQDRLLAMGYQTDTDMDSGQLQSLITTRGENEQFTYTLLGDGMEAAEDLGEIETDGWAHDEKAPPLPAEVRELAMELGQSYEDLAEYQGDHDDSGTKFEPYTQPGGKEYRELLLTLPDKAGSRADLKRKMDAITGRMFGVAGDEYRALWNERERINEQFGKAENSQFRSNHWTQHNVVAHIRFKERADAEGKRVLAIEEIQSDWAQKGRKSGFNDGKPPAGLTIKKVNVPSANDDGVRFIGEWNNGGRAVGPYRTEQEVIDGAINNKGSGIPAAPFIGKTEAWVALAMKRVIRYAVDNGFDKVSLPTGEQVNDMFDLTKTVERIVVTPRVDAATGEKTRSVAIELKTGSVIRFGVDKDGVIDNTSGAQGMGEAKGKHLSDVIGKGMAEKVMESDRATIEGNGLKIGGAGNNAFYDKIVPNVTNDLLKKLGGGRVGEVKVDATDYGNTGRTDEKAKHAVYAEQPGFDITPEMREHASRGMPLFSRPSREEGIPKDAAAIASFRNTLPLKGHVDYKAAKAGDIAAAVRVVGDLVTDEKLAAASKAFGKDAIYASPMAQEASGYNALPMALAERYAQATAGRVPDEPIVQTNHAFHTGAGAMERMMARPLFDGAVQKGGRYVLVDDVTTMGGTLAELADHIRAGGGQVVGTVVLTDASRTATMHTSKQQAREIEKRFGDALTQVTGVQPAALTAAEAVYVLGFRDADSFRDRAAKAGRERAERLRAQGILEEVASPANADENAPPSEGRSASDEPKFSRPDTGPLAALSGTLQARVVTDVPHRFANRMRDLRGLGLQALGRRQLTDIYQNDLPALDSYNEMAKQMDAEKSEAGAEADMLVRRWSDLDDERRVADLMHSATLAGIDPSKPKEADASTAEYERLLKQWDELTPEAQAVYRDARDMYETHYRKVKDAIKAKIARVLPDNQRRRELLERMDDSLFGKLKGVYFPLARFGEYVIVVHKNGEKESVQFAETLNEAEATRAELRRRFQASEGYEVGKITKRREFNAARDAVGRGFLQDLFGVLDELAGFDDKVADQMRDAVNQLYLTSLPDLSWAKHGIHRKGTPGFSHDARRAFANNLFHGARYLAKLRYADRLQDYLRSMQETVDGHIKDESFDSVSGQQVVDEMTKRHDIMMNPKSSQLSTSLTSFGFVFHLGLSPASAIVNMAQTPMVAYPILAARYGWARAGRALMAASKQTMASKNELAASLKGDERAALDQAIKDGTVDVTLVHDLAGIAAGEDSKVHWKLRPVMRWASFLFHHAERFNRQATFIAAYRLARGAGKDHKEAFRIATEDTYASHFDYSACVDAATEILTTEGWKRHDQLTTDDIAIAVDPAGAAVESKVLEVNVYEGENEVIHFASNNHFSMVTTPNHDHVIQCYNSRDKRWQGLRKVRADALKKSHHLLRTPIVKLDRQDEKYGVDMAALVGWVAAEGWYAKYRGSEQRHDVRIGQSMSHNPAYVAEIRALLTRLGGEFNEYFSEKRQMTFFVLRRSLGGRVQAIIPQKLLEPAMLRGMPTAEMEALLDAFAKGDGAKKVRCMSTITQKDGNNLDVLQAMAVMCAMRATRTEVNAAGIGNLYLGKPEDGHRSHVRPLVKTSETVGLVWCPTTEHGTWIARRNGATFVTGNSNRPRVMQGNVARVLLLFKQFGQNMVYTISRNAYKAAKGDKEARRVLAGLLVTHALGAGIFGLPAVTMLLAAASMLGSDDDDPWDAQVALRNLLADAIGQKAAEVLVHGISRLTPFDISARVGLNSLIFPDVREGLEGADLAKNWMAGALGPVAGIAVNGLKGIQSIADGKVARGFEELAPAALRGPLRSVRFANEGARDKTGISLVDEVSPMAVFGQAMGFSPSQVREATEGKSAVYQADRRLNERRRDLLAHLAQAKQAADAEAVQEAMDAIRKFNKSNPSRKIDQGAIASSLRLRAKRQREAENGIYLPKSHRDVSNRGRFAAVE